MLHDHQQENQCLDLPSLYLKVCPIQQLFSRQQSLLQSSAVLPLKRQSFQPLPSRPPVSELRPLLQLTVELPQEQQFSRLIISLITLFLLTLLDCFTKLADLIVLIHSSFYQSQLVQLLLFVKLLIKQQLFLFQITLVQLFKLLPFLLNAIILEHLILLFSTFQLVELLLGQPELIPLRFSLLLPYLTLLLKHQLAIKRLYLPQLLQLSSQLRPLFLS